MTRGNFVLIEDGNIYASIQFNGDMYPSGNGKYVYYLLQQIDSKGELRKAIQRFDEAKFGYAECDGVNVKMLEEFEDLDFSQEYFSRFNSDYLYIKNADNKNYEITDRNGREWIIHPDEIQIWYFGERESVNDEELYITDEEKAEVSEISTVKEEYIYSCENDVTEIFVSIIKEIAAEMKAKIGKYVTEQPGIVYDNGTFAFKNKTLKNNDPNFTFRTIRVYWKNDMDDMEVHSDEEIGLKELAWVRRVCLNSIA